MNEHMKRHYWRYYTYRILPILAYLLLASGTAFSFYQVDKNANHVEAERIEREHDVEAERLEREKALAKEVLARANVIKQASRNTTLTVCRAQNINRSILRRLIKVSIEVNVEDGTQTPRRAAAGKEFLRILRPINCKHLDTAYLPNAP